MPKDIFGRILNIGDLVVYGHSGRGAGTRVARVYNVDNPRGVRVYIYDKGRDGTWIRGHHSTPHGLVKIDETGLNIPKLEAA